MRVLASNSARTTGPTQHELAVALQPVELGPSHLRHGERFVGSPRETRRPLDTLQGEGLTTVENSIRDAASQTLHADDVPRDVSSLAVRAIPTQAGTAD